MKFFAIVGLVLTVLLSACGGGGATPKTVNLKNEADSLNYALGIINGNHVTTSFLVNDSTGNDLLVLLKEIDSKMNSKGGEMFDNGHQVGLMLQEMKKEGLDFNPDLAFIEKMMIQGFVNGITGKEMGISGDEAEAYYHEAVQRKMQNTPSINLNDFQPEEENPDEENQ